MSTGSNGLSVRSYRPEVMMIFATLIQSSYRYPVVSMLSCVATCRFMIGLHRCYRMGSYQSPPLGVLVYLTLQGVLLFEVFFCFSVFQ